MYRLDRELALERNFHVSCCDPGLCYNTALEFRSLSARHLTAPSQIIIIPHLHAARNPSNEQAKTASKLPNFRSGILQRLWRNFRPLHLITQFKANSFTTFSSSATQTWKRTKSSKTIQDKMASITEYVDLSQPSFWGMVLHQGAARILLTHKQSL